MNLRTTLVLFVAVVAVGAAIVVLKEKAPPARPAFSPKPLSPMAEAEENLIDEDFGKVLEIAIEHPDEPLWRFKQEDREDGLGDWFLIEPVHAKVQKWQPTNIASTLTGLTYLIKTPAGSSAMTLADAGLAPPRAIITLTNDEGQSLTVRVGRAEGAQETLVALGESDDIYRVKRSLKALIKKSYLDYLDRKLFDIKPDQIVRILMQPPADEGEQSENVELVKTGGQWMFELPARARAVPEKIQSLCNSLSTLNVVNWVDTDADNLNVFGLGDGALRVTFDVESAPEPVGTNGEDNEEAATAPPSIKTMQVEFSTVNPIDDKNKVYVRRDDERMVATLMQSVADRFKPNLKEWRDNRITEADVLSARKVTLQIDGASATFVRAGTVWQFEESGQPADQTEVQTLIQTVDDLRAVNFEDGARNDPGQFGLDKPRAVIDLHFDETKDTQRLTVGGFVDPDTRRLVYIRTDDADTVGKIRIADARILERPPIEYRDRAMTHFEADRIMRFKIKRTADDGTGPVETLIEKQNDGLWRMIEPVETTTDAAQMDSFVKALAALRGSKLIDAGSDLSPYGLVDPAINIACTHLPPVVHRMVPAESSADASTNGPDDETDAETDNPPTRLVSEPYQPPAETFEIAIGTVDRKVYGIRVESPEVVYELARPVLDAFSAELRSRDLFDFEASQVTSVGLQDADGGQGFALGDEGWRYTSEPDIPIDSTRVTNYLLQLATLKATRFVAYGTQAIREFGLEEPQMELRVRVEGEPLPALRISKRIAPDGSPYAHIEGTPGVFTLPADTLDRIRINIADFEPAS